MLTNKTRIGIDLLVNQILPRHGLKSMNRKLLNNSDRGCRCQTDGDQTNPGVEVIDNAIPPVTLTTTLVLESSTFLNFLLSDWSFGSNHDCGQI